MIAAPHDFLMMSPLLIYSQFFGNFLNISPDHISLVVVTIVLQLYWTLQW